MTKEVIFELLQKNPAFFLATVEGNQPHVRGMLLYKADDDGIVFHTGTFKDLYKQIEENPKVELCFNDFKNGLQVRIKGVLTEITDKAIKDEIVEHPSRTFLREWRNNGELSDFYNNFSVFVLKNGEATTWTMSENFTYPKYTISL